MTLVFFIGLALLILVGYLFGRSRAAAAARVEPLHSRPAYHGAFVAIAVLAPVILLFVVAVPVADRIVEHQALTALDPSLLNDQLRRGAALRDIEAVATGQYSGEPTSALRNAAETYASLRSFTNQIILGTGLVFGLLGIAFGLRSLSSAFRARNHVERFVKGVLFAAACVAVLTTVGILCSVLFETVRFFERVSPLDFLFGTQWSPQTAIRADQVGSSGAFGIVPLVTGTLLITAIAMLIAGPIGLFAAIYWPNTPARGFAA